MDNRGLAADCYKQALRCDVHCYEAFEALVQHQMLSAQEGNTTAVHKNYLLCDTDIFLAISSQPKQADAVLCPMLAWLGLAL
jgi:hypothetical protein